MLCERTKNRSAKTSHLSRRRKKESVRSAWILGIFAGEISQCSSGRVARIPKQWTGFAVEAAVPERI